MTPNDADEHDEPLEGIRQDGAGHARDQHVSQGRPEHDDDAPLLGDAQHLVHELGAALDLRGQVGDGRKTQAHRQDAADGLALETDAGDVGKGRHVGHIGHGAHALADDPVAVGKAGTAGDGHPDGGETELVDQARAADEAEGAHDGRHGGQADDDAAEHLGPAEEPFRRFGEFVCVPTDADGDEHKDNGISNDQWRWLY